TTVAINVPGSSVLPGVFTALINLRDDLQNGDGAAVRSSDLAALDSSLSSLLGARAQIGATVNRLESQRDRQSQLQAQSTELLSKVEDADLAQAVSELSAQENVYKAALAAGAHAIQPSLLDYLK